MVCPKCKGEYHCGCASCAPRHKANGVVCSKPSGDLDTCGHCGLTMHVDQWLDEEWKQMKEMEDACPTRNEVT